MLTRTQYTANATKRSVRQFGDRSFGAVFLFGRKVKWFSSCFARFLLHLAWRPDADLLQVRVGPAERVCFKVN